MIAEGTKQTFARAAQVLRSGQEATISQPSTDVRTLRRATAKQPLRNVATLFQSSVKVSRMPNRFTVNRVERPLPKRRMSLMCPLLPTAQSSPSKKLMNYVAQHDLRSCTQSRILVPFIRRSCSDNQFIMIYYYRMASYFMIFEDATWSCRSWEREDSLDD